MYAGNGGNNNSLRGTGGTINVASADASQPAASPAPAVLLDRSTLIASQDSSRVGNTGASNGGTVNLTSARPGGQGITVQNSSDLRAQADTAASSTPATVNLTTGGADIAFSGSTTEVSGTNSAINMNTGATGGTISITGQGNPNSPTLTTASPNGTPAAGSTVALTTGGDLLARTSTVNLSNATVVADVLKIQALGVNGHITIGGSFITGNSQLVLFAGDRTTGRGGLIEFVSNTTLTSNVAGSLTATTIQIDGANTVVTVNSPTPLQINGTVLNYSFANGGNGGSGFGGFTGPGAPMRGTNVVSNSVTPTATTATTVVAPPTTPSAVKSGKGANPKGGTGQIPFKVAGGQYVLTLDEPVKAIAHTSQTPVTSAKGGVLGRVSASGRSTRQVDKPHSANNTRSMASSLPAQPRAVPALPH